MENITRLIRQLKLASEEAELAVTSARRGHYFSAALSARIVLSSIEEAYSTLLKLPPFGSDVSE